MLFVTLFQPKGKGDEAVKYLKTLKPPKGIAIHDILFTFGRYDAVIVFESPDVKTAMDFVMHVAFTTGYTAETLTGIAAKEF